MQKGNFLSRSGVELTVWHTTALQAVVDCGALDSLVSCLEEFDPGVRESAAWALGYVAGHSTELASTVRFLTRFSIFLYSHS